MEQYSTPILFVVFNRIETTKLVFESIRSIRPMKLFIAADGARVEKEGEFEKCEYVRSWILEHIDWDCEVKTLFRDQNLGCGYAPSEAISWFFNHVDEGIIIEDDCLPDRSFFEYCSVLLDYYRFDDQIGIISGSNFDRQGIYNQAGSDYFFSAIPYTWGWATWKRNWINYDYTIKGWGKTNKKVFLNYLFEDREFQLSWKKVFDEIYNTTPSDIWDYQFFFSCFQNKKISIVPSSNLITNIGHEDNATHTFNSESRQANVPLKSLNFPLQHPSLIMRNIEYDVFLQELCYGRVEYVTIRKRITRLIKRVLRKIFSII